MPAKFRSQSRKKSRSGKHPKTGGRGRSGPKSSPAPKRGTKPPKWQDHYTRQAQKENYPARSVYKLKEIQQKHHLLRPGQRILDLGCAPGSWLKYAARTTGPSGRVVGIDLKAVTLALPDNVTVRRGDVFAADGQLWQGIENTFDVVLSDMAPATTGNKVVDSARSEALCEAALTVARARLRRGGALVCKIFQGDGFSAFIDTMKSAFRRVNIFKPQSSRKPSKEIFIIGRDFLGAQRTGDSDSRDSEENN